MLLRLLALALLLQPFAVAAASPPVVSKDLVYGRADGHDLALDLYIPALPTTVAPAPRPIIVFLHGGGWRVGSKKEADNVVDSVTGAGYALASVDYRLSGEAIFPAQIQDCKTAVRFLRANAGKYGLDPKRIGVMGFSAGGHLAALLGTSAGVETLEGRAEGSPRESSRVQAVCDVSGPVDLSIPTRSIIGKLSVYGELAGSASEKPALVRAANPTTYITGQEPPFLIIQGDQDKLVLPKHAEVLAAALRAKKSSVELVTVQGGGHVPFGPEQADTTIKFLDGCSENEDGVSTLMSSLDHARQLDANDPLRGLRSQFHPLPAGQIYFDGNSLGLLPLAAETSVQRALNAWKTFAIGGWLDAAPPWFTLAERLAARVAPLVGAQPAEVAIANSTTVNLHQGLGTLFQARPDHARTKILAFADEFPSDLYAVASHLRGRGLDPTQHLTLLPSSPGGLLDENTVLRAFVDDPTVQLAVLPAVVYTTGQLLDLAALTAGAHRAGVVIGFDLSHSVGVVPHALDADGVDFAFWCHYKYLNAGPGAPGGLYLHTRHAGRAPGLAGWWGSHKQRMFDMGRELDPAEGASALQIGTPTILGLAALDGALDPTETAGIRAIREKSLHLTAYLMAQLEARLPFAPGEFRFANPREDHRRGGHVALAHPEGARLCRALKDAGVVTDFRPPDIVRFAPVPLYNTFEECHETVERLCRIMSERAYLNYPTERALVT